jgi:hypothetical protein
MASATKHTAGPWMAVEGSLPDSGRKMFRVRADNGSAEPVVSVCYPTTDGEICENAAAANARLIAAAPSLLEALKSAPDMANFWEVDGFGAARNFDKTGYVIAYSKWTAVRDAAIAEAVRS